MAKNVIILSMLGVIISSESANVHMATLWMLPHAMQVINYLININE
jgi:hypothetical protein